MRQSPVPPMVPEMPEPDVAETPSDLERDRVLAIAFLGDPNSVHTRRWTGYFASRGYRITLIVGRDVVVNPGLPAGIAIERFEPYSRRRGRLVGALVAVRSFRRVLKTLNPDVLHAHYLTGNGWLCLLYTSPSPRDRTRS